VNYFASSLWHFNFVGTCNGRCGLDCNKTSKLLTCSCCSLSLKIHFSLSTQIFKRCCDTNLTFLAEAHFSIFQTIQIEYGAHLVSCLVVTWGSSLGHEPDHSSPSSGGVKNEWRYTSVALFACVACRGKNALYLFCFDTGKFCLNINPVRLI